MSSCVTIVVFKEWSNKDFLEINVGVDSSKTVGVITMVRIGTGS